MVVLGLGRLVPDSSSLAVAVAVAVAAIFQPARRRIQQVDLDSLRAELLAVADQTMQPTTVSLWLRPRG